MIRRKKPTGKEIEDTFTKKKKKEGTVEFIHSGSLLLNLAISGKGIDGGWARGRINNLVGDGSSGKTLLALETCAKSFYELPNKPSNLFPAIKKLSIVYNNIEGVMDFPVSEMYGEKFYKGVEWIQTPTCQSFGRDYMQRLDALKQGECLIYVCDSLDALDSIESQTRLNKSIKTGKEIEGSFGTERAKYFSQTFFRSLCDKMKNKDATLFIINQIREKLDAMAFGEKYYRTGGKSLDFYTHIVAWLYQTGKLKKTALGHERIRGVKTKVKIKRNKVAKPFRECNLRILFDYGLDDIGTIIDFIYPEKDERQKEQIIKEIETKNELENLNKICVNFWQKIEDTIRLERKSKYE